MVHVYNFRLLIYGGTHRLTSHYGCWNCNNKRLGGLFVVLLQYLLLTMSRNLLTKLKEFSIQQYIPLDTHIQFHKIAACTALFFSLLHTVGHIVNFYHVSTQPIENLKCLTNEVSFPSDYKPGITFWLFQTITGIFSN